MNPYDDLNPLLDPVRPYFGWFGDDEEEDIFGRITLPAFPLLPRAASRLERPARGISRAGRSADTESEAA